MSKPLFAGAFENKRVFNFMEFTSSLLYGVLEPVSTALSKAAQIVILPCIALEDIISPPNQKRLDQRLNTARYKNRVTTAASALRKGANPNIKETEAELRSVPFWMPDLPFDVQQPVPLLVRAAEDGKIGMMKALLRAGAEVNATGRDRDGDYDGVTALMGAAFSGHKKAVRLLLDHGANINLSTSQGRSALDFARFLKHDAIADVLKAAGAQEAAPASEAPAASSLPSKGAAAAFAATAAPEYESQLKTFLNPPEAPQTRKPGLVL